MNRQEWAQDVKLALLIKGKSIKQMAHDLGVSRNWIYTVLCGDGTDKALKEWEQKIDKYCGLEELK